MEQNLKIELDKCIKCKACARCCPTKVIEVTAEGAKEAFPSLCIACGHCVAVCPVAAIKHLKMSDDFGRVEDPAISFDQFNQLGRNRRSIRSFKFDPIKKEILEKVLDAVRYIPTASNAQELQYLIISDPKQIKLISSKIRQKTESVIFRFLYRLIYGKKAIEQQKELMSRFSPDEDYVLRGAPVLMIIYVKDKTPLSTIDAGIAGHHMNLACETLGLGVCWMGLHTLFSKYFKSIKKASLIPEEGYIVASLGIGYSAEKYYKTCARNPLNITWI